MDWPPGSSENLAAAKCHRRLNSACLIAKIKVGMGSLRAAPPETSKLIMHAHVHVCVGIHCTFSDFTSNVKA